MKSFRKLTALLLSVLAVSFMACDPKEEDVFGKPAKDKDFTVTVNGNNLIVECTNKAMTSVLWEVNTGVQSTEKVDTFYVPIQGDYTIVLSVSNGGDYVSSDTIPFTIATSDVTLFETGIWKSLTGGPNVKKTWVLDVEKKFFHKPVDFYGDAEAGLNEKGLSWGPWGGFDITDPEIGEISFVATSGVVTLILDGATKTGKYNFNVYDRPADIMNPVLASKQTLWENMTSGAYKELTSLSAQMGDLKLPSGVRFPLQIGRMTNDGNTIYPSQFLTSDLENVTILHCSDSSLIVRVKRSYEKDAVNKCWMLYNFRVKEYTYAPKVYTEPINVNFDANTLAGTWKVSTAQACGWVNWVDGALFTAWDTRDAMMTDLFGWWSFGDPAAATSTVTKDAKNAVTSLVSLTFNNGSYTIHDAKYDATTSANVENNYTGTYTVSKGKITFSSNVTISALTVELSGTQVGVIDPANGSDAGIWIGYKNGEKTESSVIQIVKQ